MPAKRKSPSARTVLVALISILLLGAATQLPPLTSPINSLASGPASGTSGSAAARPAIEGWVKDKGSGLPVAFVAVSIESQSASHTERTETDTKGYFSVSATQLAQAGAVAPGAPQKYMITVRSEGYAEWSLVGALYYPGDTLRVYATLSPSEANGVVTSTPMVAQQPRAEGSVCCGAFELVLGHTMSGAQGADGTGNGTSKAPFNQQAALAPPATIRIYRTQTGVVEIVPFKDYVKHVLPLEWVPTWGAEALKAGAMAAKSYAWYWVSRGGKRGDLGADLKDNTDDQVYDPNVSYASTDAAVDATYNYALTLNGALFQTQYCAGTYSGEATGVCPWSGPAMSQWGSAYLAERGKSWGWITQYYYQGAVITPRPPGGGYDGTPLPTPVPGSTSVPPTPVPPFYGYVVGQGTSRPDLFQDAYDRNGGAATLGRPINIARWWLPYLSENNVIAQPFSGRDGRGNVWIVYDVLKASSLGVQKAFVLSGNIAAAYAAHIPPGPEWVGAPTSDPYTSGAGQGGVPSQGFTKGTLVETADGVQFDAWPQQFAGWKSEYFVGHEIPSPQNGPSYSLPGQPALVSDLPSPDFDWSVSSGLAESWGVGRQDWSLQATGFVSVPAGSYDFTITTDGGLRLWVDGLLAINNWQDRQGVEIFTYDADLSNGIHTIRIQYYSPGSGTPGRMTYKLAPHGASFTPVAGNAKSSLRVAVRWLGRQQAPADSWVQPLTLTLSAPGSPAVMLGTYRSTTDRNGVAFYQDLPAGIFDVHVKGLHSLQSARASISLSAGATTNLDMKAQIEGDLDGDNCVTIDDFSVVQGLLGASSDTPGFLPAADLNGDGIVAMDDISLLRSGFERCGDISADNEFRLMSSDAAPSLLQALAPWLNPSVLSHNLAVTLVPSKPAVKAGDIFSMVVVAQTGQQAIDGASFILHYNPQQYVPIDSLGNAAAKIEPGLALPAVMGNWIDTSGGAIGYMAGVLQGGLPAGRIVVATVRFRVLSASGVGPTLFSFSPAPSPFMQLTGGGANLLAKAPDLTLEVTR